ncbi:MAG: UDP-N-acetylmuramoylalanyl-D-glutamate--2,6-diaminopimelate ligase [Bacteroidetes bacterium]|nr:MAG: UDP-N-acetylmuramoylalanyl-D-glutamate--2,6-diaminopimelate ligase [Bacteroidota bacterium]
MSIEELYKLFRQFPSIQTDTRKLSPGDIFFALKGDHFDGNLFARQAVEDGAAYAIVDENIGDYHGKIIRVENSLKTLQDLAKWHRQQFSIPFLAVTGSNGKTTTKELIHAVLSSTYKTYTTEGNLNNHIGIPLTILKVKSDAAFAVVEMGANHQKEIQGYCEYTMPTHGIITNAGKAHLEGFGSLEGVKKGKGELYDYLRAHQGTAFVMADYDYLREMSRGIPHIIRYGTNDADLTGHVLKSEPFLSIELTSGIELKNINTQLTGEYNLPNVLAAVSVGSYFKVPANEIKNAIENYVPSNSRSQLIEKDSNKIILDAYNANPSSMSAAIRNLAAFNVDNKVLILGAMAELGAESIKEHEEIISLIEKYPWKQVVLVGGDFLKIQHPFLSFENSTQAREWFQKQQFHETYFLIKGSRSMQMEKVIAL